VSINLGSGLMVGNTEKVIEDLQNQGIPKEDAEKYGDDLVVGNIGKFTLNLSDFKKLLAWHSL